MKKTAIILLLILSICDINVVYAQSKKKAWTDMSVKEKRKAISGLESEIGSLKKNVSELRADSLKTTGELCKLDSEYMSNKAKTEATQKKIADTANKRKSLEQDIKSVNSEISNISRYDQYIVDYVNDKLRYPWNSSVNSAITAIDSIKSPTLRNKYAETKTLLKEYENLYNEVLGVINEAQKDGMRTYTDTAQIDVYKSKWLQAMNRTNYISNYKGKIPFLDRMVSIYIRILNQHSKEHPANFSILLHYDAIEKM